MGQDTAYFVLGSPVRNANGYGGEEALQALWGPRVCLPAASLMRKNSRLYMEPTVKLRSVCRTTPQERRGKNVME